MGIATGLAKVFRPRTRSIPKTPATQAIPLGAQRFIDSNLIKAGAASGVTFGAGLPLALSDPKQVGTSFARLQISLEDGFDKIRSSVEDVTRIPQVYFMEVEQAYKDEIQRQQELKNIEEFGDPRGEEIVVPPTIEEQALKPVSLFFAEGGELDMQGDMMQPQMQPEMPMGEVSQMEVQEAQQGLVQILQVIETLIQQGLSEDEIIALLAQYGITEAELEQAAQVLGVDMEQLLGGAQMEQPQMEVPQQPMMMANGGPASPQEMFEALPLPLKDGYKIALDDSSYLVKDRDTAFGPNGEIIGDLVQVSSYLSQLPQKYNSLLAQKSEAEKMNRRNIGANIFEMPASVVYPEGSSFGDSMRENRANRAMNQKEMALTPGEMIFIDAYESHFNPKKMANGGALSDKDIAIARSMLTPDNEPMFQSRSPEGQIFSLNNRIQNLMTSYDMLVRNNEFERAQEVADEIDEVQQQIIAIQSQNVQQTLRIPPMIPNKPGITPMPPIAPKGMGLGQKKN